VLEAQNPSARYIDTSSPAPVQHFEMLATAYGGVARLRELILALAVSGRLVQQVAADEPASSIVTRVDSSRAQLQVQGCIKPAKRQVAPDKKDYPFELPASWEWVVAADVCVVITDGDHQAPPRAEHGVPFLVIGDVRNGTLELDKATRLVPQSYFDELDWAKRPLPGDVLYTTVGSLGIPVPVVRQESFCFQRHIALFRPGLLELQGFFVDADRKLTHLDR
jgi:type I restriction enzyme S subunit